MSGSPFGLDQRMTVLFSVVLGIHTVMYCTGIFTNDSNLDQTQNAECIDTQGLLIVPQTITQPIVPIVW